MKERRRFRAQNFEKLRKACISKGQLFVDTQFPPTNASLFLDQARSSDIVWKRPAEIHEDPHLFVEGASANDVTQGILGNCWFVSACSALTHNQHLLDRVIPYSSDQEWSSKRPYAGIFRFRFWRFGQWVEVVIDDLLPTRHGKLIFARSKTPNEFWSALLEKAFAKLYGCYENLVGGHLSDALQDVSGGVAETINVEKFLKAAGTDGRDKLFKTVKEAFDNEALIVAAIAAKTKEEIEQALDCGLVKGHAYAVTAVKVIDLDPKTSIISSFLGGHPKQKLIRLQNPWGEKEWNGPWSDNSREWEQVPESVKKELGIAVVEDGDFWMPWESFVQYFTDLSVCQLLNTSLFTLCKRYHEQIFFDEWTTNGAKSGAPNDMAGGCLNFTATFCNNPQYLFEVSQPQSDVMFALTQKEPGEGEKRRDPYVTIGMHVMKVENNRIHRVHQAMVPIATSDYANARSVFLHLSDVNPGRYIVLPTTFAPRELTTFMLRIYCDHNVHAKKLTKHAPSFGLCGCRKAGNVTRIVIHSLEMPSTTKEIYLTLTGGKNNVRTQTKRSGPFIEIEEQFVFHRGGRRQQFLLELWEDRKLMRDKSLGCASIMGLIDNDSREMEVEVPIAGNASGPARVKITLSAFDDPMYL